MDKISEWIDSLDYKARVEQWRRINRLEFECIESERLDLVNLKSRLKFWNWLLVGLSEGEAWPFPRIQRELQDSTYLLHKWCARAAGKQLPAELWPETCRDNRQLKFAVETTGMPQPELIDKVVKLVANLQVIWAVATVKYAETVASKYEKLPDRLRLCEGVVDFIDTP